MPTAHRGHARHLGPRLQRAGAGRLQGAENRRPDESDVPWTEHMARVSPTIQSEVRPSERHLQRFRVIVHIDSKIVLLCFVGLRPTQ